MDDDVGVDNGGPDDIARTAYVDGDGGADGAFNVKVYVVCG